MVFTPGKKRTTPPRRWADGRSAFRAHAAAILAEIERGRSLRSVWEEFKDRLGGLGYEQFTRYVKRARRGETSPAPSAPPSPKAPPQRPSPEASTPRGAGEAPEPRPTFHFDPMDAYRKKFV